MMLIHADQVGMLLLAGKHQLCTLDIWIHVYFGFYVISVNLSELLAKNVKVVKGLTRDPSINHVDGQSFCRRDSFRLKHCIIETLYWMKPHCCHRYVP